MFALAVSRVGVVEPVPYGAFIQPDPTLFTQSGRKVINWRLGLRSDLHGPSTG
jgi:hypothetical protein